MLPDKSMAAQRIGIYSGTFDPVHQGHIVFAWQAMLEAGLAAVYLVPERRPRYKTGVSSIEDREAMLRIAIEGEPHLQVLTLPDDYCSVASTLTTLQQYFAADTQLLFLFGSDVAVHMPAWDGAEMLADSAGICVGLRQGDTRALVASQLASLQIPPERLWFISTNLATAASADIRACLREGNHEEPIPGAINEVISYAAAHRLYTSP